MNKELFVSKSAKVRAKQVEAGAQVLFVILPPANSSCMHGLGGIGVGGSANTA
jgi:hypothetical protein